MSRSQLFRQLRHAVRLALYCEDQKISTAEGLAREAAAAERAGQNRRQFLMSAGALAAAGAFSSACSSLAMPGDLTQSLSGGSGLDIGIVGAGLAGLVCADQLRQKGVTATLYEGNTRVGGRQWSLSGFFPGQVVERGG